MQRYAPSAADKIDYSNKLNTFCTDNHIYHDADVSIP